MRRIIKGSVAAKGLYIATFLGAQTERRNTTIAEAGVTMRRGRPPY